MDINTNNLVSINEASQDFSRVAKLVDENGVAVILKNNVPRYVLMEYSQFQREEFADDAVVKEIGEMIVKRHLEAFKELAK
ncbi:MAG: type II toxin-antitoxin system Phd/YefM family antitoxin [Oscillospiraceae bacterium]|jgi:antitoxin Phd|nr:type II toxin-antitoxin system Phd/YefM family antitoxin [Oscillospiraceae bacterium]